MDHDVPFHAHIYFEPEQRSAAEALRGSLERLSVPDSNPQLLFVGRPTDGKAGPHPIPQFEVHFLKNALDGVLLLIEASGLRALVHPLTDDDMADHTTLAHWIGEQLST